MLSRSRKAKGRVLQNKVREILLESFEELEPDDIKTAVMGESGEDIHMSPAARRLIPLSIECKNQESLNIWKSHEQAEEVYEEIYKEINFHPRKDICMQSIKNWGLIVICENYETCIELSNKFAPEHLEIITFDPQEILKGIENAGAIFLGKWTPEAVGDYLAGPNHTLPTSGNSRFSGSLGVETFMKNTSIIEFNEESLKMHSLDIINLAKSEGLHSHANSVQIRFED